MKHIRLVLGTLLLLGFLSTSLVACSGYESEENGNNMEEDWDEIEETLNEESYPEDEEEIGNDNTALEEEEWDSASASDWSYDGEVMTPNECYPDEVYDPVEQVCYLVLDCETDEECDALYEEWWSAVVEGGGGYGDEYEENSPNIGFDSMEQSEDALVVYQVSGNKIFSPSFSQVSGDLQQYQQDFESHKHAWEQFIQLIPLEERSMITEFSVFTDGAEETMAYVFPIDEDDLSHWQMAIDLVDAKNSKEMPFTLIHEFGHVLTLNSTQLDVTQIGSCLAYEPQEGCARRNSYLNAFYYTFWDDIYDEWLEIDSETDDDRYYELMEDFYYKYEDQFITDYAATNVEEDIAESWTYFVLQTKPDGDTIAEQKILFFYDYPELVTLRKEITERTISRLMRP
jgi:hypothetical protein